MRTSKALHHAVFVSLLALVLILFALGRASAEVDETDLAKKTQNPVSDLISVPFQNNFYFGTGPNEKTQYVLNIQPVIPFHLNSDWNLISRTILPIIHRPELAPGLGSETGLGDINATLFLAPSKPSKFIWGAGPTITFPSATDRTLGSEKWSAGPAVVGLTMQGPWVFGALVNNQWSFAGDSDRADVNSMLIQTFVNYNLPEGWYLSSAPIITADWEADSDNRWTVPVGGGFGKIFFIGKLPLNASVQAFYNVEKPDNGPDWSLRAQIQFLLPK